MDSPSFRLEGIVKEKEDLIDFEGPLSLILMLLKKNKIEIRDIKIADILDQYLEYLAKMQEMDLEIASEFVQMASYLVFIKTRMLLSNDSDEVSELEMLIESLEQLKAKDTLLSVKEVTGQLLESYRTGSLLGVKPAEPLPKSSGEYQYTHSVAELLEAMKRIFDNPEKESDDFSADLERAIPHRVTYSVKTKSREILLMLKNHGMVLSSLYQKCRSKSEVIATFLSVLELCSSGNISVGKQENCSEYLISFTGGDIEEIIEKIDE